jgi:membrane protease YdiL (CAAX protease family)
MKTNEPNFPGALITGGILTVIFSLLFLYFNKENSGSELGLQMPFFMILYFLLFSIGQPGVSKKISGSLWLSKERVLVFPLLLIVILYVYIGLNGQSPFGGSSSLFAFYFCFPVLGFLAFQKTGMPVVWSDFVFLLLFLIPATMLSFEGGTGLPYGGSGFGSVLRIVIMLGAVYAYRYVRNISDIGFFSVFKTKYFAYAAVSWLLFVGLVMLLGYVGKFMTLTGPEALSGEFISKLIAELIRIFIGTALFEELFFRGLMQNMLAKKIGFHKNWPVFWKWGFAVFVVLSVLVGYGLNPKIFWFPVLIHVILFGAAWFLEKKQNYPQGTFTSMAVVSMFFGLVHYHAGSLPYVGLACVAGWAYGYTYLKTKNVFYAALVHTLVNASDVIFGLEIIK